MPLISIYNSNSTTPKLLNHLHILSLESPKLSIHLFFKLNTFPKNHYGLWVIDCYNAIRIVSWLLSRILPGNQISIVNWVISFHFQGYWGFFLIFSRSRGSNHRTHQRRVRGDELQGLHRWLRIRRLEESSISRVTRRLEVVVA